MPRRRDAGLALVDDSTTEPRSVQSGIATGTRLGERGRYEVLGELGRGRGGRVCLATDHLLARTVAIKFPVSTRCATASVRDALAEARLTATLCHPNIVTVFDYGLWNEQPFFVMEYVEGSTLCHLLSRGAMQVGDALDVVAKVAEAMVHAHERDVLHLDLKPSNVIVSPQRTVSVIDFGLAASGSDPSGVGGETYFGTPLYMAPEQWRSEPLDQRTDVWALGMLAYETLVGGLPFEGPASRGSLIAVGNVGLPWAELEMRCPPASGAIHRALATCRDDRTPTAYAFLGEILASRE